MPLWIVLGSCMGLLRAARSALNGQCVELFAKSERVRSTLTSVKRRESLGFL